MTSTEQFLLETSRLTDLETVWSRFLERMGDYGFNRVLYAVTRFRTDFSAGDIRDAVVMTNYPKEFTDPYLEGGLFRNAPMVRWAMKNTGTLSWATIAEEAKAGLLPPEVMEVVAFNRAHGIIAGYGISFPRVSPRTGHGVGLSSTTLTQEEVEAIWATHGCEIELICQVCHLTMMSLPHASHGRQLTVRQREVLELVADGKTIQDVALLMGRNPATVEKHLRLARDALDVETTAQAILKTSIQNQFFRYEGDAAP
ncbi:LuxR family transcriptional regulator [Jannaschia pohangensis]|uniref:LuxR family transcriptional regulator n=1 Tax=Jannaschia pohangensis TaxID=390807 RepID=UPI001FE0BF26|nr:LuxR family transcriptional regulator [Jannaschia pohangensis]